jgi:hypothetical protein
MSPTHPRGAKQGAVGAAEAAEALQALWMGLGSRLMVQVVCLTIDDRQVVCIAPVLHAPDLGICAGDIQAIEFGELMPAFLAAKLLQDPSPDNDELH